jgi:hypothetical protein
MSQINLAVKQPRLEWSGQLLAIIEIILLKMYIILMLCVNNIHYQIIPKNIIYLSNRKPLTCFSIFHSTFLRSNQLIKTCFSKYYILIKSKTSDFQIEKVGDPNN